jgi:hypothetical protein
MCVSLFFRGIRECDNKHTFVYVCESTKKVAPFGYVMLSIFY